MKEVCKELFVMSFAVYGNISVRAGSQFCLRKMVHNFIQPSCLSCKMDEMCIRVSRFTGISHGPAVFVLSVNSSRRKEDLLCRTLLLRSTGR